jgi:phosphatidylinositol glycan class B
MKILHKYIENTDIKVFLKKVLIISGIFHFISAIFSTGFHHWDEHYQIYEFLGAKLGFTEYSDLTWEYPHKMRSWIQPGMYYLIAKPMTWIGLGNPFCMAFVFRLITSAIGFVSLFYLNLATLKWIKDFKYSKWAILLTHFLWFIPYIQNRTSSESMSGALFAIAIALIALNEKENKLKTHFFIGLLMGLSFQFRFQMGFTVMFAWFWQIFFGNRYTKGLFLQAFAIILCFGLEFLIARWGYGEWTFTPWNYVYENLVLNKQAAFGNMPWWDYFRLTFSRGIFPISFFIVTGVTFFWMTTPKHLLTWATLPLLVIHAAISAKALRYMFPIATFAPIMMVLFYEKLQKMNIPLREWVRNKWFKKFSAFTWRLNLIILVLVCFQSANPMVNLLSYLYSNHEKYPSVVVHGLSPFTPIKHPTSYYTHPKLKYSHVASFEELLSDKSTPFKIVDRAKWARLAIEKGCKLHYSIFPEFILTSFIMKPIEKTHAWALLECR